MVAKYAIEHWCRIPVEVELASEFRYRDPILDYSTLVVAISQSGETADTLQAIRHARTQRSKVLAICNTNGSTIPRESDAVIYTHAGPEIGVASTKGFLTQLVACYLLALYLAQVKGTRFGDEISDGAATTWRRSRRTSRRCSVDDARSSRWRSRWSARRRCCSWAGTPATRSRSRARSSSRSSPTCTPRGSRPGELKHGPIALVEEGLPVLLRRPAPGPRPAPRQDAQRHPGGPGPRRADHLPGRGGRRPDHAVRRRADPAAARSRCCCSRSSPSYRSSCSPASWRR